MARYRGSAVVDRTPEEAFAYLADFSNVAEWDPSVRGARRVGPGPLREDTRFRVELEFLGQPLELEYRITRLDRPREVVLQADAEGFRSVDTIRVEPARGGRARISYDARIHLLGARFLLDAPLQLAFAVIGRNAMRGLRRALGGRPDGSPARAWAR